MTSQKQEEAYASPHRSLTIPLGQKYGSTPEYELAALAYLVDLADGVYPEDSVIVEIGSLVGKSTISMACVSTYPIVAIDPHTGPWELMLDEENDLRDRREEMGDTLHVMIENLEHYGVRDKVEIIQKFSNHAAEDWDGRKICILFIDGNHEYEWVKHDFEAFRPHMVDAGTVVFHDYHLSFPGVRQYVDEAILDEKVVPTFRCGTLLACQIK